MKLIHLDRWSSEHRRLVATKELEEASCNACGRRGGWRPDSRVTKRQNSRIQHFRCTSCGRKIVVKKCVISNTSRVDEDQAVRERRVLAQLSCSFPQDALFGTLVPMGKPSSNGIVATEYFPGRPLADLLRRARSAQAESLVRIAAEWLRLLHATFENGQCSIDVTSKLDTLCQRWSHVARPHGTALIGVQKLRALGALVEGSAFPRVKLHGDFKPENLLFDGDRMLGLDCALTHENAGIFDVAPFLNHVVLDMRSFAGRTEIESLEQAFLEAYQSVSGATRATLAWARLYFLLSYWCTGLEQHRFLRTIIDRRFAPHLAKQIERVSSILDAK